MHDGRFLECIACPGFELVCDVEAVTAPAATRASALLGLGPVSFLRTWTLLEVYAKLCNIPVLRLLARWRSDATWSLSDQFPDVTTRTEVIADLVVSVGWRRRTRPLWLPLGRGEAEQPVGLAP